MSFNNKVVWITGASSGIGEHLAIALAKQGARLILSSRNVEELQRVKAGLPANTACLVLPLDVTAFETIPQAAQLITDQFGHIDILINNAGVSQRANAMSTTLDVDQKLMNINYFGAVAVTRAAYPMLQKSQAGHIVVISSVNGKLGVPYRSAYAASKHALHGFFEAVRGELYAENIHITLVCPGYIKTKLSFNALQADGKPFNQLTKGAAGGMAPEELAPRILRAVERKKEEVAIGGKEIIAIYLKRFFPRLLTKLLRKQQIDN